MPVVSLAVNGRTHAVDVAENATLLDTLRDTLGLKGTRFGCGLEQCGACTVLIDGMPAYSCSREVRDIAGACVTTIEALSSAEGAHPLQRAFVDEQAGQCGYCLAGILLSAKALLDRSPRPTRAEIVAALDRHLCRCGAHNRIIRAIEVAAQAMQGEHLG